MSEEESPPADCWLYSEECREGQIFAGVDVAEALDAGWQDRPVGAPEDPAVIEAAVEQSKLEEAAEAMAKLEAMLAEREIAIATANDVIARQTAWGKEVAAELEDAKARIAELEQDASEPNEDPEPVSEDTPTPDADATLQG